jgi:glycosyltransferase involved in cell wall biosynthesis
MKSKSGEQNLMLKSPTYVFPEFAKGEEDPNILMRRLDMYGQAYSLLSSGGRLILLIGLDTKKMREINPNNYQNVKIIQVSRSTRNVFKFAYLSKKILNANGIRPSILIAGDLYFAFLTSLLLKFANIRNLHLPIQISIHGFYLRNLELGKNKLRHLIRMYLLFTYKVANSIRAVSMEIKEELNLKFRVQSSKIFVSPVPLTLGEYNIEIARTNDLLFVGRFHEERGIGKLEEIFELLQNKALSLKAVVVGSGPLLTAFKLKINLIWPNCRFEGFLERDELNLLFSSSRILLSTAPTEGYGLTIREALAQGCFLVARENEVTRGLASIFPNLVYLFNTKEEAVNHLQDLLGTQPNVGDTRRFRDYVEKTNAASLECLTRSWLNPI